MEESTIVTQVDDFWVYCLKLEKAERANIGVFGSIDCSYSMDALAKVRETSQSVSFLSLIQSVFSAIVDTVPTGIELKFGSFADQARQDFSSDSLTDEQRQEAKAALGSLRSRGSTNLSAAIELGYTKLNSERRIVLVLTDGDPTVHPNVGELAHMKGLVDSGDRTTLIIMTIANSKLDLKLMHTMAVMSGGYMVYINDASMGATCVINAMAAICTIAETNLQVSVESDDIPFEALVPPAFKMASDTFHEVVNVGLLMTGSFRTIVCRIPREGHPDPPKLTFSTNKGGTVTSGTPVPPDSVQGCFVVGEMARHLAVLALAEVAEKANILRHRNFCQDTIKQCTETLSNIEATYPKQDVATQLLKGFDAQLELATRNEYIGDWGHGAIYAALHSHWNRICTNFKDPDVQMYATTTSADIRAKTAASFTDPQAEPAHQAPSAATNSIVSNDPSTQLSRPRAPPDMSQYLNLSGGCIAPNTLILTEYGSIPIQDLSAGTRLRSGSTVLHVVCMRTSESTTAFVQIGPQAFVTPFHPIDDGRGWMWPSLLNFPVRLACDAIYNVIVDGDTHVEVERAPGAPPMKVVALGHGLCGKVVEHDVYGDRARMLNMARTAYQKNNLRMVHLLAA